MNDPNDIPIGNGVTMPAIGFGTYKINGKTAVLEAIRAAYETGYRHIDTASFYENETEIGAAIRQLEIPRDELFITSKVWFDEDGYDGTLKAFERSCKALGTDYLDLYLIHWPTERTMSTWMALERLYAEGKVRSIGVSNFSCSHLREIVESNHIKPMINQVEIHPGFARDDLRRYCDRHGIHVSASAPLGRGNIFTDPVINEIAESVGKSPAQVVLRWHYQLGIIPLPKSTHRDRIEQNIDIFDFHLSIDSMQRISAIEGNTVFNPPEGVSETQPGDCNEA